MPKQETSKAASSVSEEGSRVSHNLSQSRTTLANPKKRKHAQRDNAAEVDKAQATMMENMQKNTKRLPAFMQSREKEASVKR